MKELDSKTDEEILLECDDNNEYIKSFVPHEGCWKLDARGSVGETALHLLILHSTPLHNEIAKILLNMYPKLALDFYEGEEYYGTKTFLNPDLSQQINYTNDLLYSLSGYLIEQCWILISYRW